MHEIEFDVLCANDSDACNRVKDIMSDFKISSAEKTDDFDHKGVKVFDTIKEAEARIDEIKSIAGENVIDITMRVRR